MASAPRSTPAARGGREGVSGCPGGCAGCWALSFQEGRWEWGQPWWDGAMEAPAHSRASSEAALCRALDSWVLDAPEDGDCTASLNTLPHSSPVLTWKSCFPTPSLTSFSNLKQRCQLQSWFKIPPYTKISRRGIQIHPHLYPHLCSSQPKLSPAFNKLVIQYLLYAASCNLSVGVQEFVPLFHTSSKQAHTPECSWNDRVACVLPRCCVSPLMLQKPSC